MKLLNVKQPKQLEFEFVRGIYDEEVRLDEGAIMAVESALSANVNGEWIQDVLEDDFTLDKIEIYEGVSNVFIGRKYNICDGPEYGDCAECTGCDDEEMLADPVETVWCPVAAEVIDLYENDITKNDITQEDFREFHQVLDEVRLDKDFKLIINRENE